MVHSFIKKGAPAWAYAASNESVRWFCLLRIAYKDTGFAVSLEHSLLSNGANENQTFMLRYEGDNLVPGKNSLRATDLFISASEKDVVARHGKPNFQTLSLTLKNPCSILHPKNCRKFHDDFPKLLTYARATKVHVFFDTKLVTELDTLRSILAGSQEFTRLPKVAQSTNSYEETQWPTLRFIPDANYTGNVPMEESASGIIPSIEDAGPEARPFEHAESDSPPAYADVAGSKRLSTSSGRMLYQNMADMYCLARPSSTPDHDPKRARQDSSLPPETERATPAPSLRAGSTADTVVDDLFGRAVTSAVKGELPQVVREELPQVVKEELPQVVREELTRVLERLFRSTPAIQSPPPYLSPAHGSRTANALPPDATPTNHPTLHTMINQALARAVRKSLDTVDEFTAEICKAASIELEDFSDGLRFELQANKETLSAICNDEINDMLAELKDDVQKDLSALEDYAEKIVLGAEDRLREISNRARSTHKGLLTVPEPEQIERARSLPVPNGS